MKAIMYVFVMTAALYLSSCSHEEETLLPGVTSEQAVARFKSYFYKEGKINANKLENFSAKEWAVATDNSGRACEVFTDITGVEAPLTGNYEYSYSSADGKCIIRIVGTISPNKDAIYATLYIDMEDCPDFSKIYIVTKDYFNDSNEGSGGVPVIL